MIELTAKDKNEKLQYEGKCKLIIDSLSKILLVEPVNEEFKMITAMFKWKFVAAKNILFIFAEHNFQDFSLIFNDTRKCNKVYSLLFKNGATSGDITLIKDRFLLPLFNEISMNDKSNSKMKEILLIWIEKHEGNKKKEYIQLLKDTNIYDLFYSRELGNNGKSLQKQKANNVYSAVKSDINISKWNDVRSRIDPKRLKRKRPTYYPSKIIEAPDFEVFKYVQRSVLKTRLYIFTSTDRKHCYEYCWHKYNKNFVCHSCRKKRNYLSARIINRNGKDVIQLNGTQHVCEPRFSKAIVEKCNFKIVSYESKRSIRTRLIIFLDSSRVTCYEYYYNVDMKLYYCSGCASKKHLVVADICQKEKDGTEFALLYSENHFCEPHQFNPDKYAQKEKVQEPNFKIYRNVQNGIDRSKLVIFASFNKTTCYEYYWCNTKKHFVCYGCTSGKKVITAQLCQNLDGSSYLKLSKQKHVCDPREYDPEKFKISNKIVESSNYKIFQYKQKGASTSKLVIFCQTNKNLCYEYFWNNRNQMYNCSTCPFGNQVTATVFHKANSEQYLMISKNEHVCELREFNPEKFKDDNIIKKSLYTFTTTTNNGAKHRSLIIFTTEEKKFYYKFCYHSREEAFHCSKCFKSKIYIFAVIQNEGKENEFAYLVVFANEEKSKCYEYTWSESLNYFLCIACKHFNINVYARLIKNDEGVECVKVCHNEHKCSSIPFLPEDITQKCVKFPYFKLWEESTQRARVKKLAILDSETENLGYDYSYPGNKKLYKCQKCASKHKYVTARILQDENGEDYVEMNGTEHVCELQKLNLEDIAPRIVKRQDFKLWDEVFRRKKVLRLGIYKSEDKKLGYIYSFDNTKNVYKCVQCFIKKKFVTAKKMQDENGEDYFELNKIEHVCELQKL